MANNRKHDRWLTDEQVETEISVLKQSPAWRWPERSRGKNTASNTVSVSTFTRFALSKREAASWRPKDGFLAKTMKTRWRINPRRSKRRAAGFPPLRGAGFGGRVPTSHYKGRR